ncbi:hypothetical protein [Methanolobus halotolerans]|nr:hypothetical protein [Methanolobus halotolerans]
MSEKDIKVSSDKKLPFLKCPRYKSCSVNNCPLDPCYPYGYVDKRDYEKKCTLAKPYRSRIGKQFSDILPRGGLTTSEYAGRKSWDEMSEQKRSKITEEGKKRLKALHLKNKIGDSYLSGEV